MAIGDTIRTSTADITLLEGNLIRSEALLDCEMDLDGYFQNMDAVEKLTNGSRFRLLMVYTKGASITVEARTYRNPDYEAKKIAEAIVIESLGHRLLANVYARTRGKAHPIAVFGDEAKALAWIVQQG